MAIIGYLLMLIGCLISLVYGIKLIRLAFQESIWWGLGFLLIPFVSLIFIILTGLSVLQAKKKKKLSVNFEKVENVLIAQVKDLIKKLLIKN